MSRAMTKRSVTLDPAVAAAVEHHVESGAAESFSAAINDAASRWAANQDLREALDAIYAEAPEARPTEEEVASATERMKSAREHAA
jgi:Arc/MetJ-type ribon-helix-helix transcriptional regulator